MVIDVQTPIPTLDILPMFTFFHICRNLISRWWTGFTLQTKLLAAATFVVSLLMSGLTFWAVNTIQMDARFTDTRFGRDLGLLLATNVAPLVASEHFTEAAQFSRRFYESTSSVRYILYADGSGEIRFGIPFSDSTVENSLTLHRRIELPDGYADGNRLPVVRQHPTPDGNVTDVFVPLVQDNDFFGALAIGINPNPTVGTSSHLTIDVTIATFITIWVLVILGAVFNALTITRPIKELSLGVKNITDGNFQQRINLPFGGELGELISSFNLMAERLEKYEEQNFEELTSEKAKLETLVSTIVDGAVLLNNDMQVVLANPTAKRLLNWENDRVVGQNVLYILPTPMKVEITRTLFQIMGGDRDRDGAEFRITLNDPFKRTVRILLTTVLDIYRETVKGVAMTIQDITREAELNEAKSQFISNVSHELRTPLFNIKSFIETLQEYGDSLQPEEQHEFLETANRETDRLTRLVNDMLDLSRLESGKTYPLEPVDIVQPIEQVIRSHSLNARDKGIELIHEISSNLSPIIGNYDLLLQVLTNLMGNALKFTHFGGRVILRAYTISLADEQLQKFEELEFYSHLQGTNKIPHVVRIEIGDTGIGIDHEDQQAIFDRFFRVENRVHTLEGTGLGLSIVRNIIEKHHTTIHLVSEVGIGTTFWFDLPVMGESESVCPLFTHTGGND